MENIPSLGNRWPNPQWKIFGRPRGQADKQWLKKTRVLLGLSHFSGVVEIFN
jgi:hypothetical protein